MKREAIDPATLGGRPEIAIIGLEHRYATRQQDVLALTGIDLSIGRGELSSCSVRPAAARPRCCGSSPG